MHQMFFCTACKQVPSLCSAIINTGSKIRGATGFITYSLSLHVIYLMDLRLSSMYLSSYQPCMGLLTWILYAYRVKRRCLLADNLTQQKTEDKTLSVTEVTETQTSWLYEEIRKTSSFSGFGGQDLLTVSRQRIFTFRSKQQYQVPVKRVFLGLDNTFQDS